MGNSLDAQLLKAGLIDQKKISKAKKERYKQKKKQRGKGDVVSESKVLAQKTLAAEKEQIQQLNRERKQQEAEREITAQIGQMIGTSKVKINDGDLTYNFADNNKIKKIYVNKSIRDQLSWGQLSIVKHREQYVVVPAEVARKIAMRNSQAVLILHEPQKAVTEDDPYAAFPIPDDLEW